MKKNIFETVMDAIRSTGFTRKQSFALLLSFIISAGTFLSDKNWQTHTFIGHLLLFLLFFVLLIFFTGRRLSSRGTRRRTEAEVILLSILSGAYFIAVFFIKDIIIFEGYMPVSIALPTALVVLLFFGGKKIPELMRGLGKGVRSFKEGVKDMESEVKKNISSDETVLRGE